jgi:energy-coupling factor transporter ATP-binding protein EcfA2
MSGVPRAELSTRIAEVLERVELGAFSSKRLKTFSKGMLQRAGLAQAILHDPDLLRAIYAVYLANKYDGLPVWTLIVGKPGSGKSELLASLEGVNIDEAIKSAAAIPVAAAPAAAAAPAEKKEKKKE